MLGRVISVLVVLSLEHCYAQVQKPLSGPNEPSQPQGTSVFAEGINQFTGQVQFSLPLLTIGGKGTLSYSVSANYSSLVQKVASTWNREAPTGVLGLGWSLNGQRIVADHKFTVNREDDDFYLVADGGQFELIYDGMDGSDWKFYTKSYQFWKVRYNPTSEKWTITKEDGTRLIFGGDVPHNTIQYMVGVRDWIGNTNQTTGGVQVAYVWDLAKVVDLFDDAINLEYIQDFDGIGGTLHTRASYLSRITNSIGEQIVFQYQNKLYDQIIPGSSTNAREFQDPHTESGENDAFQETFESKYLDKIVRYNESNESLGELRFGYQFLGSDEMTKRLFTSYTSVMPNGQQMINYVFEYEPNNDPSKNYGALIKATLPTSGYVSYSYQAQELGGVVPTALVDEVTDYREPKAWFGPDYVVISRRKLASGTHSTSAQSVILDVFTWESGSWIKQSLGDNYNNSSGTLYQVNAKDATKSDPNDALYDQDFQVVIGKDFFATLHHPGTSLLHILNTFTRDEDTPGLWNQQQQISLHQNNDPAYQPYVNLGTGPKLLAGEDYFVVAAAGGNHFAFVKNGDSWTVSVVNKPAGNYTYGSGNNFIISTNIAVIPNATKIHYLDKGKNWNDVSLSINTALANIGVDDASWTCGTSSALLIGRYGYLAPPIDLLGPIVIAYAIDWGPGFQNVSQQTVYSGGTYEYYPYAIPGADNVFHILFPGSPIDQYGNKTDGGLSVALVGNSWVSTGMMDYQGIFFRSLFSYGEDFIIRPVSGMLTKLKVFNRNTGSWQSDVSYSRSGARIIAGPKYFVSSGTVLHKSHNGTFSSAGTVSFLTNPEVYPIEPGIDFLSSSAGDDPGGYAKAAFIKNGMVVSEESLGPIVFHGTTYDQRISDMYLSPQTEFLPSPQVGGHTLITYFEGGLDQSMSWSRGLKIYRDIDHKIDFSTTSVSRLAVSKVAVSDGSTESSTWFTYDLVKATIDAEGNVPLFNSVTVIPGSSSPTASPNGFITTKYYNGKAVGDMIAPYEVLRRLTGLPYKHTAFNSSGSQVSETQLDYTVFSGIGTSKYIRQSWTKSIGDGKSSIASTNFNLSNGMPSVVTTNSLDSGSPPNPSMVQIHEVHYWFEQYDPSLSHWVLSPTIEEKQSNDGVLQNASVTKFMSWGANNIPLPWQFYRWRKVGTGVFTDWSPSAIPDPTQWKLVASFDVYNDRGLLTQKTELGVSSSIVYDPVRPRAIAKFANAPYSAIQYFDFESATSGTSVDAFQGSKSSTLTLQITPSTNPSWLSYWQKLPGDSWELVIHKITAPTSIGGGGALIDVVRVYPVGSLATSSSFDKHGNVSSVVDENNRITRYAYDDFQRLRIVRDQDNNIISHTFTNIKN